MLNIFQITATYKPSVKGFKPGITAEIQRFRAFYLKGEIT